MPYKRKRYAWRRKRRYRRKTGAFHHRSRKRRTHKKGAYRGTGVVRGSGPFGTGFPNHLFFKHYWTGSTLLTSATNADNQMYRIKMNSIWDPDESGSATQPAFRDDISAIYNQYYVYSSELRVYFTLEHSTGLYTPVKVYLLANNTNTYPSGSTKEYNLTGLPNCRYKDIVGNANSNLRPTMLYMKCQPRRIISTCTGGVTDPIGPTLWANKGADPSDVIYYCILASQSRDVAVGASAGDDFKIGVRWELIQHTRWSNPYNTAFDRD